MKLITKERVAIVISAYVIVCVIIDLIGVLYE